MGHADVIAERAAERPGGTFRRGALERGERGCQRRAHRRAAQIPFRRGALERGDALCLTLEWVNVPEQGHERIPPIRQNAQAPASAAAINPKAVFAGEGSKFNTCV